MNATLQPVHRADSSSPHPLYEQVAENVTRQIESGALRAGDRVPSVRRASQQHRVSVSTAVQAYIELENRGLIEARPQSGFYVRARLGSAVPEPQVSKPARLARKAPTPEELLATIFGVVNRPDIVPLGAACPSPALLPVKKLNRILASVSRSAGARGIEYDMPPGAIELRRQIARRSMDWGANSTPDEIITMCGSMEGITLCLRAVTKPGDAVAIESPTYFGILQMMASLQLKAVEIPTHPRSGMDLEKLDGILKTLKISACVAVPNFSNPLGSLMPDANKERLVKMLTRRGIPLIEDDVYGDLYFGNSRPQVAKSYDTEGLVMLCGSLSKTLAAGYRVGWAIPGRFHDKVRNLKFTSTVANATAPQLAAAEFLANGGFDHHLRGLRRTFAVQVERVTEAVVESFPRGIKVTRPAGGFVIWVELPKRADALELHRRALAEGISVTPGPLFSAVGGFRNFLRLSCGYPWSAGIERGIGVLGYLVKQMCA